MEPARMVPDTDEDSWAVYVGVTPVLRQESYQVASNLVADLNGVSRDPTTEVAEIADGIRKAMAFMPDDLTVDNIRERLSAQGYPTSYAAAVRLAWVEGRIVWTAARLVIFGKDACDLRPDDAPLCGHSPRGRT